MELSMKIAIYIFSFLITGSLAAQINVRQIGEMPEDVWETSGLLFHKGKLITHNDSGNTAQLFEVDTLSLSVTRSVTLSNAQNVDWEDIAQDDTFIYIADFGNNLGTRQDLKIYRILKSSYDSADTVLAEEIAFSYEDQTDFSDSGNSDWDAEALFVIGDRLIVLTKQWKTNNTVAYSIPNLPGSHIAQRIDEYTINGLVTGATYNPQNGLLYVVGYNSILGSFIYKIEGVTANSIFGGTVEQLETNIGFAQTEGITHISEDNYMVSSERFVDQNRGIDIPSLLFSFTDMAPEVIEPEPEMENRDRFVLFRQFGSDRLEYSLMTDKIVAGWAIFDSAGKRIRFVSGNLLETETIDISTLHSAVYYFSLYLSDEMISRPFLVD